MPKIPKAVVKNLVADLSDPKKAMFGVPVLKPVPTRSEVEKALKVASSRMADAFSDTEYGVPGAGEAYLKLETKAAALTKLDQAMLSHRANERNEWWR